MKKILRKLVVITLVVGIVALVGIASQTSEVLAKEKVYRFFLISHGGPGDPFWGTVFQGMKDAEKMLGGEVKTTLLAPKKHSIEILLDFLDTAMAANPDGIGITITSIEALDEPLRRVIAKGTPVIAFNTTDPRPENERIPCLSAIGQMEFDAGAGSAKGMLKVFKPTRAVVATHKPGAVFSRERIRGIMSVLEPAGVKAEKIDVTLDPAKGVETLKSYKMKYPETDAILTVGTMPTHYGIDFITEENLKGKVKLGGFDVDEKIMKAIVDEVCLYTIDQQAYLQGYLTVHWLYLNAKYGFRPPERIPTGPTVITKDTLYLVKKGLKQGVR